MNKLFSAYLDKIAHIKSFQNLWKIKKRLHPSRPTETSKKRVQFTDIFSNNVKPTRLWSNSCLPLVKPCSIFYHTYQKFVSDKIFCPRYFFFFTIFSMSWKRKKISVKMWSKWTMTNSHSNSKSKNWEKLKGGVTYITNHFSSLWLLFHSLLFCCCCCFLKSSSYCGTFLYISTWLDYHVFFH